MKIIPLARRLILLCLMTLPIASSPAALVSLTTADTTGNSGDSFELGTHWSDSTAPSAANDYAVTSSTIFNNPATTGYLSNTFGGNSLTLTNSTFISYLWYKSGNPIPTMTINNLTLNGSTVVNKQNNLTVLAGNITLVNANTFNIYNGTGAYAFNITAAISGTGRLNITKNDTTQATTAMVLAHANNTYTGGTTLASYAYLDVQADGALGTGDLTMNGGLLTLELGATNNYIADTARFKIASGLTSSTINLNFTGSDSISGLSLDGGTTYLANGIYSASTLNSLYGSTLFTGSGTLNVVPEPSSLTLLALGSLGLLVLSRRQQTRMSKC